MKINIGVLGSQKTTEENLRIAEEVGKEIAKAGAVLICGGRGGIMRAAAKGCKEENGLSVGIIPVLDKKECDCDYLEVVLPTSLGYGRNIFIASSCDVLIAIDGNYGTMSEVAFALNYKRPVVVIKGTGGTADYLVDGIFDVTVTENAKDAVEKAMDLAK